MRTATKTNCEFYSSFFAESFEHILDLLGDAKEDTRRSSPSRLVVLHSRVEGHFSICISATLNICAHS